VHSFRISRLLPLAHLKWTLSPNKQICKGLLCRHVLFAITGAVDSVF